MAANTAAHVPTLGTAMLETPVEVQVRKGVAESHMTHNLPFLGLPLLATTFLARDILLITAREPAILPLGWVPASITGGRPLPCILFSARRLLDAGW